MSTRFNQAESLTSQMEEHSTTDLGQGVIMKDCSIKFLNAVMDPFKSIDAARVPDFQKQSSICMRDYVDNYIPVAPANLEGTDSIDGMLLLWDWGWDSTIASKTTPPFYRLQYYFSIQGVYNDLYEGTITTINADTILPNDGSGSFTPSSNPSGLAQGVRIFAGGIKVLPVIETITSSDTLAVRNYWGGYMTPQDWSSWTTGSYNLSEIVRNSRNVQEYPNAEGVTVRYDPFQYEEQLEFTYGRNFSLTVEDQEATKLGPHNTDGCYFPFVYINFTDGLGIADIGQPFPIKIFASFWMESILKSPSPIYSMKSPVDLNFDRIRALAGDTDRFPPVTKGHSFADFLSQAHKFVKEFVSVAHELAPVVKPVVKAVSNVVKKKKVNRKVKKVKRRKPGTLSGIHTDGLTNVNRPSKNL